MRVQGAVIRERGQTLSRRRRRQVILFRRAYAGLGEKTYCRRFRRILTFRLAFQ